MLSLSEQDFLIQITKKQHFRNSELNLEGTRNYKINSVSQTQSKVVIPFML